MDIRKIKKLIELVEESGISELEISEGEESVRISRARVCTHQPCRAKRRLPGYATSLCCTNDAAASSV